MGALVQRLDAVRLAPGTPAIANGSRTEALDTASAWVLQRLLQRLRGEGAVVTVFANVLDVLGGMIMARQQLGVGFVEFLDRFVKAAVPTTYLTGIGKAPVLAAIIAVVGCYQGFRTKGGANRVGRQTPCAVVQSIFLVIVADAMVLIVSSGLDL